MTKKWRFLTVYAIILIGIAAYFFVFEVYKKRKEIEAKEAERKVFSLNIDDLREITISKGTEEVSLVRDNDRWRITSPVETDTDHSAVSGFVNTLVDLRVKKWIGKEKDLSHFGLKNPLIIISAKKSAHSSKASSDVYRLLIGEKTPAGDGTYAMAFVNDSPVGKEPLFVIDTGISGVLSKGLYELRKKELATFEDPQVKKVEIRWHGDNRSLTIVRETEGWSIPDYPDVRVKKSKMDHIVDQIRWLRAQKFIGNSKIDATSFSLSHPIVNINLEFYNKSPLVIQLGEYRESGGSQNNSSSTPVRLEAFSSELPFVAVVDRYILNELPHKPEELQDRSLFSWKEEEIAKITWHRGNDTIELTREEGKNSEWKLKKGTEKNYSKLKEGWKVRSVIWAASDIEYEKTKEPVKTLPEKITETLRFYDRDGHLLAEWNWQEVSTDPKDSSIIWAKKPGEDEIKVFMVPSSKLKNLAERLKALENPGSQKS